MGMWEVMEFLARNEGFMFTNEQLSRSLAVHPQTLAHGVSNIRQHWIYQYYFRSRHEFRPDGGLVAYHYVVRGTGSQLFKTLMTNK